MRRRPVRTAVLGVLGLVIGGLASGLLPSVVPASVAAADTAATGSAGLFVPVAGRLLDTRNGTGGYTTPMPANTVRTVPAAGVAGIPSSGVSALALTLTAVGAPSAGAISVAPGDVATPTGTALVFNPSDSVSNTDLVALHADGQLHVLSNAAVNLIIDVQGYFTAGSGTAPGGFVAVDQTRIVDTRNGTNVAQAQVANGGAISVTATGLAGVPSDASAVYVNIAVLGQTVNGYLRTYAAGAAVPTTGALGFDNSTQSESVAIPLSGDGAFTVLVGAGGPVDLIIDIQGYFTAGNTAGTFTPAAVHLLDTRAAPVRTIAGNGLLTLPVAGVGGLPAVGASLAALALNLRTVQPSTTPNASGYLRLWPGDQPEPVTSSLNYTRLDVYRTDLAIVSPAADGTINIRNGGPEPIDVVIDVEGWFADPGPSQPDVESEHFVQGGYAAATSAGDFEFYPGDSDGSTPTSYSYSLDGAAPVQVSGTTPAISVAVSTLGAHTLSVTATDKFGLTSPAYVSDFSIGTPPTAPQAVSGQAGATTALLSWAAPTGDGGVNLEHYLIYEQQGAADPTLIGFCDAACRGSVITGLTSSTAYSFTITAMNAAGESSVSAAATVTTTGSAEQQCPPSDNSCEALAPTSALDDPDGASPDDGPPSAGAGTTQAGVANTDGYSFTPAQADQYNVAPAEINPWGCVGTTDNPHRSTFRGFVGWASVHARTKCHAYMPGHLYLHTSLYRKRWYGQQYLASNTVDNTYTFVSDDTVAKWNANGVGTYTYTGKTEHEADSGSTRYYAYTSNTKRFSS